MKKKLTEEMSENELLFMLLAKKTGAIDPYTVISIRRGAGNEPYQYYIGGKKAQPNQAMILRSESQMIKQTTLYKFLTETLRQLAHLAMFENMKTLEDQHYGKAMLHCITSIEQIIGLLAEIPEDKNVDKKS
jgi:hypothetical protein